MKRRNFLKGLGVLALAPKILASVHEEPIPIKPKEHIIHSPFKPFIEVEQILPPKKPGGDILVTPLEGYKIFRNETYAIPTSYYELFRVVFKEDNHYVFRPLDENTYFEKVIPYGTKISPVSNFGIPT